MSSEKPDHWASWTRIATRLALALLLIGVAWLGWRLCRIWRSSTALRTDLEAAQALARDDLRDLDVQQAISLVRTTQGDLEALQSDVRPFLWIAPGLAWLPRYGATIQAAPVVLDVAVDLAAAGETLVDQFAPLLEGTDEERLSKGGSVMSEATATLVRARPQLTQTLAVVRQSRSTLGQLQVDALHPRLAGWVARLDRYLPPLEQGLRAGLLAPDLLGAERPRRYLLLVQNEDERRATGGFISGVAQIQVTNGHVDLITFEDSYALDDFSNPYPHPPGALRETTGADLWVFRDSNWSPDFPTSARKAIELFSISREAQIDGVVALDQRAISLLVGPLGPLQVDGSAEPITGQNVIDVVRRAWAPSEETGSDWWRHRKDIMGDVLSAAVGRMEGGLDRRQLTDVGLAALKALREKHVLLYLESAEAATLLRDLGWDGALASTQGDYLLVVDSNVGFNKVNAAVEENLEYAVDLSEPDSPRATLTVHHRHPVSGWTGPCSQEPRYNATYQGLTERCYYNYLRVYVPSGAELVSATSHPVPGRILLSGERHPGEVEVSRGEGGKTMFATFFVVRPGEHVRTALVYDVPSATVQDLRERQRYRLTIQKQPGTDAHPIDVSVRLPSPAQIAHADPAPSEQQAGFLQYELELSTDVTLEIIWTLPRP